MLGILVQIMIFQIWKDCLVMYISSSFHPKTLWIWQGILTFQFHDYWPKSFSLSPILLSCWWWLPGRKTKFHSSSNLIIGNNKMESSLPFPPLASSFPFLIWFLHLFEVFSFYLVSHQLSSWIHLPYPHSSFLASPDVQSSHPLSMQVDSLPKWIPRKELKISNKIQNQLQFLQIFFSRMNYLSNYVQGLN